MQEAKRAVAQLDYYDEKSLSAAFYDAVTAAHPFRGDIDFYANLAGAPGASVLELGCGTGRVAIALARLGYTVTGVDLAHAMLSRAAVKRKTLPPDVAQRITLVRADMTRVALGRRFDAVIIPFYGYAHLPDAEARGRTLAVVAGHLRPGGRAAIHVLSAERLAQPLSEGVWTAAYTKAGDRVRVRAVEREFDAVSGRFRQVVEYVLIDADGADRRRSLETLIYYRVDADEMEHQARVCGLQTERAVAPFSGSQGEELVYTLVRKPA